MIDYTLSTFGEGMALITKEIGSSHLNYFYLQYFDEEIFLQKPIKLENFFLSNVLNWNCKDSNRDRLSCAFVYSSDYIHYFEFSQQDPEGPLKVEKTIAIEQYDSIITEKIELLNSGMLVVLFHKILNSGTNRADDSSGFYIYKIDSENNSYETYGGIGRTDLRDQFISRSKFRIKNYRNGVLVKMRSNKVAWISTGDFELTCKDPELFNKDSPWLFRLNKIG